MSFSPFLVPEHKSGISCRSMNPGNLRGDRNGVSGTPPGRAEFCRGQPRMRANSASLKRRRQAQRLAAAQVHLVVALEQRRQRGDFGQVHGRGLVDAREALLAELREQIAQRPPQQILRAGRVDVHVVVVGLQPVDLVSLDELQRLAARHEQALAGVRGARAPSARRTAPPRGFGLHARAAARASCAAGPCRRASIDSRRHSARRP